MTRLTSYFKDLDKKFNFLAQDKDGTIAAFTHKPHKDGDEWENNYMPPDSEYKVLHWGDGGTNIRDWEDSLIKRGEE